jgi:Uma2 family endonuclease
MLTPEQVAPDTLRPLRRHEYDALAVRGVFAGERLELLQGALVHMSPESPRHAAVVDELTMLLVPALKGRAKVRVRGPFAASNESEPQPDLAVVFPGKHTLEHPASAFLVIEVADTTLDKDRRLKSPLYAAAGVLEYWLVNLEEGVVEVHRAPADDGYRDAWRFSSGETISLAAFPDVLVRVRDFLG